MLLLLQCHETSYVWCLTSKQAQCQLINVLCVIHDILLENKLYLFNIIQYGNDVQGTFLCYDNIFITCKIIVDKYTCRGCCLNVRVFYVV